MQSEEAMRFFTEVHHFSDTSLKPFFRKFVPWDDMNWEDSGPLAEVSVEPGEMLSHYLFRSEIRADNSLKPDAIMPHPHEDLSVTRHKNLTEDQIWDCATIVAGKQNRRLFGRADFLADSLPKPLLVKPDEPPCNHAGIFGWPSERSDQMAKALLFAPKCECKRLPC